MQADTHFKRLMESIYLYQTNIQVFLQAEKKNILTFLFITTTFFFQIIGSVVCYHLENEFKNL
jgi:hypothetical protein